MKVFYTILLLFYFMVSYSQVNLTQISFTPIDITYNNSGLGISDTSTIAIQGFYMSGMEYAIVNTKQELKIYNITVPSSPNLIYSIPLFAASPISCAVRQMALYNNYLYVAKCDFTGMAIFDLNTLPLAPTQYNFSFSPSNFCSDLYISPTGKLFTFETSSGGFDMFDITLTPTSPTLISSYLFNHLHDGLVVGNKILCGPNADGIHIVDISNPSSPVFTSSATSPGNMGISEAPLSNPNFIVSTDIGTNTNLHSWDISDINNPAIIDNYYPSGVVGANGKHNQVVNDYVISAFSRGGVRIVDAHEPDILVEVGNFITNSLSSATNSCVEVSTNLPSGLILAADYEKGWYVLQPNYQRASYVRGTVTDSCGNPLIGVKVKIPSMNDSVYTDVFGQYKYGCLCSGNMNMQYSLSEYSSKTIIVNMVPSVTQNINTFINLTPTNIIFSGSSTLCNGSTKTLNVTSPSALYTYQWYLNGSIITGATGTAYTANTSGLYKVIKSKISPVCSNESNIVNLTFLNVPPTPIITSSSNDTICSGTIITLNSSAVAGYNIQWFQSGTLIPGANSSSYTTTFNGSYTVSYSQPLLSSCASNSVPFNVTVIPLPPTPTVSLIGNDTICYGATASLNTTTVGSYGLQWYNGSTAIVGATSSSYSASNSGLYSVKRINNIFSSCLSSSSSINITELPDLNHSLINLGNDTICGIETSLLQSNITTLSPAPILQWYKNGILISGATSNNYLANTSGSYTCIASYPLYSCNQSSLSLPIVYYNTPTPSLPFATTVCGNGMVTYTVANVVGHTYYWTISNGTIISGQGTNSVVVQWNSAGGVGNLQVSETAY